MGENSKVFLFWFILFVKQFYPSDKNTIVHLCLMVYYKY